MGFPAETPSIIPSDKLQIVIFRDGSIGMIQPSQKNGLRFSLAELQMLATLSSGVIGDLTQGLGSHLIEAGLDEVTKKKCEKLAKKLFNQKRLVAHEGKYLGGDVSSCRPDTSDVELPEGKLALHAPCAFLVKNGGFQAITHAGFALPCISAVELHALSRLAVHPILDDTLEAHRTELGSAALDREQFISLLKLFFTSKFVVTMDEVSTDAGVDLLVKMLSGLVSLDMQQAFQAHAIKQDAADVVKEQKLGRHRPKVIPVACNSVIPAGLGAVIAYSKEHEGGVLEEFYNFRTDWVWDPERLEHFTAEPAIYLFSNYLWTHKECLEVSAQIKALSPYSITIHGGPDTPKYPQDEQRHYEQFKDVDITVRGEGEVTCAEVLSRLREVIGGKPDLSVLEGVEGCSFRSGSGVVRNPDRGRVKDVNALPSPYLTGLFDAYKGLDGLVAILETNRGCPYGCTFCDWGSATASKIRKFDKDRVMAELGWASRIGVASISIADANFGIFPRDVDFAREAARLSKETGYPMAFGGNYAKNTVVHLRKIVDVLAEGNILTRGTLSLQTMDEDTLDAIKRSNIKTEKYDALATEMRKAGLPLSIELMMGLPGATVSSFREDLQQCIDRELPVRVNMTTLLVNSPMNHPDYMKEHEIKVSTPLLPGNQAVLASTSSYTEEEMGYMNRLNAMYTLCENHGVLRVVSRFIRHETGLEEVRFYEQLMEDTQRQDDWPILHLLCFSLPNHMAPPVSWALAMKELNHYLQTVLEMPDSPALRSVLAAQLASIPALDRHYPEEVELECDVSAWFAAILAEKERGNRRDWFREVPRLESFENARLVVGDSYNVTSTVGTGWEANAAGMGWELDSPLHRSRIDMA